MKRLAILAALLALTGCRDEETARRVLHANGFHDIVLPKESRWFGCGRDDAYLTPFRAVSTGGQPVTGVVCSGWGKGATIRFD